MLASAQAGRTLEDALPGDRRVGFESRKTYSDKLESGFLNRFLSGPDILEIGYKGYYDQTVPIVPQAIGLDIDYPGYDGVNLPFTNESFDAIYSSHCLEHISDYVSAIKEWYRVLRIGGYIVVSVPHQHFFEKKRNLPSLGNDDHKRFYTARTLLAEIEQSLEENSYRIRHLQENDAGFDYENMSNNSPNAQFEIETVIEKIRKPNWNLNDGTVRPYAAAEFMTHYRRNGPWEIVIDLSADLGCVVFGPYIKLEPADYLAEFCFEPIEVQSEVHFDVALNNQIINELSLEGEEGRELLAQGKVSIPFSVGSRSMNVAEFRLYNRMAVEAILRFKGVNIAYAR